MVIDENILMSGFDDLSSTGEYFENQEKIGRFSRTVGMPQLSADAKEEPLVR